MIRLHLIRHGETIWHGDNRYAGRSDIALTERGLDQARALRGWASRARLASVTTSDLSRAVVTGHELAAAAGLGARIDPRLREVDFGQGEGLTRAEMHARFPEALARFFERPATHPLPEGESGSSALVRAEAAVLDLIAQASDDSDVAVVAHTTIIRLVLCRTLGLPLDDYRRRFPSLGNTTITTLLLPRVPDSGDLAGVGALERYNSAVT